MFHSTPDRKSSPKHKSTVQPKGKDSFFGKGAFFTTTPLIQEQKSPEAEVNHLEKSQSDSTTKVVDSALPAIQEKKANPIVPAVQRKSVDDSNHDAEEQQETTSVAHDKTMATDVPPTNISQFKNDPIAQLSGGDESAIRQRIIAIAQAELGKVKAKQKQGMDRVLEYFKVSAPDVWTEEDIKRDAGVKLHWCGIFAIYCIKKAGINVGNWQIGKGVSAFGTLQPTTNPQPGDIGYMDKGNHHALVEKVDGEIIESIDGNSGIQSEVIRNKRNKKDYVGFFTAFTGSQQAMDTGAAQQKKATIETPTTAFQFKKSDASDDSSPVIIQQKNAPIQNKSSFIFPQLFPIQKASADNPPIQRQATAKSPEDISSRIFEILAMSLNDARVDELYRLLQEYTNVRNLIKSSYETKYKVNLENELKSKLDNKQAVRALAYLNYGQLRISDKIYLASKGIGSLEENLVGLSKKAFSIRSQTDNEIAVSYGTDYKENKDLTDKSAQSRTAGVLEDELSGGELIKAKANLTFGQLRPADEIAVALDGAGTDNERLYAALRKADKGTIKEEYKKSYGEDLIEAIDGDMDFGDYDQAMLILDGKENTLERLKRAKGTFNDDEAEAWRALQECPPSEREELKKQYSEQGEVYQILSSMFNAEEMERARALLFQSTTALELLKQAGGFDEDTILPELKMADPQKMETYKRAYLDNQDRGFRNYIDEKCRAAAEMNANTILTASLLERARFAAKHEDMDYLVHLIEKFASNDEKKTIAEDAEFKKQMAWQSDYQQKKIDIMLRTNDSDIASRIDSSSQSVKNEHSWLTDMFSDSGEMVADEQRELEVKHKVAAKDGKLDDKERQELEARLADVKENLEYYVAVRNHVESYAETVLSVVASVVVSILTGGAAAPAMAAALARQLALAAVASGISRVVVNKVVKGDRFKALSDEGLVAFGAGAIDGVMNVFGPAIAKNLAGPAIVEAAKAAASKTAQVGFGTIGKKILLDGIEGGISAMPGTAFENAANKDTWKGGFLEGMEKVLTQTAVAGVTGTAMGAGMSALGSAGKIKTAADAAADNKRRLGVVADYLTNHRVELLKDNPLALNGLLDAHGNWKALITHLEKNGHEDIARKLFAHRKKIVAELETKFNAKPLADASDAPVSDVDLSVYDRAATGTVDYEGAGKKQIEAEKWMAEKYGADWSQKFRMNFYSERGRLQAYYDLLTGTVLDEASKKKLRMEMAELSEALDIAQSYRHAQGNASAMERVAPRLNGRADEAFIKQLAEMTHEQMMQRRNAIMLEIDDLVKQRNLVAASNPQQAAQMDILIAQKQKMVNFFSEEAYIGASAMGHPDVDPTLKQGGTPTSKGDNITALENINSQLTQMEHIVAASEGQISKATREYEIYKYIYRSMSSLENAGIPLDAYLKQIKDKSYGFYKLDRPASAQPQFSDADLIKDFNAFHQKLLDVRTKIRQDLGMPPQGTTAAGNLINAEKSLGVTKPAVPGNELAKKRGYPNAPEGHSWVNENGEPVLKAAHPDLPKLQFENGQFKDPITGKIFATQADADQFLRESQLTKSVTGFEEAKAGGKTDAIEAANKAYKDGWKPKTTTEVSAEVEALAKSYDLEPLPQATLPAWLQKTFYYANFATGKTKKVITLYRAFGGSAHVGGGFAASQPSVSIGKSKADSALLDSWGNALTFEAKIDILPGQTVSVGKAAPQVDVNAADFKAGGGDQILLPNGWIKDTAGIQVSVQKMVNGKAVGGYITLTPDQRAKLGALIDARKGSEANDYLATLL